MPIRFSAPPQDIAAATERFNDLGEYPIDFPLAACRRGLTPAAGPAIYIVIIQRGITDGSEQP